MKLNAAIFCLAATGKQAEEIATRLKEARFRARDISVLFPDELGTSRRTEGDTGAGALARLLDAGQLTIPGTGVLIAAGPIMAAMAGAAALGTTTGGVTAALTTLGLPEPQASTYDAQFRKGHPLVCLRIGSGKDRAAARQIFKRAGAGDIVEIEAGNHIYNSAA